MSTDKIVGRHPSAITIAEILEIAKELHGCGDGRKVRLMIDAVRDAMVNLGFNLWHEGGEGSKWQKAMIALDMATVGHRSTIAGFQTWEADEGRTYVDCQMAFDRASEAAK